MEGQSLTRMQNLTVLPRQLVLADSDQISELPESIGGLRKYVTEPRCVVAQLVYFV